ncbi:S8 family serine peptidase [Candidatus Woesearchaeota archaeon]|nr:S8 family serine peptidase [Candidatus Woesearchaeota archaeon]
MGLNRMFLVTFLIAILLTQTALAAIEPTIRFEKIDPILLDAEAAARNAEVTDAGIPVIVKMKLQEVSKVSALREVATTDSISIMRTPFLKEDSIEMKKARFTAARKAVTKDVKPQSDVKDLKIIDSFATILTQDQIKELENLDLVEYVFLDATVNTTLYDSVPLINADDVWNYTDSNGLPVTGEGVTIAIIDTGIDYNHPDIGDCFGAGCKVIDGYDFYNDDSDPMDDHGHGTHVASTAAGDGVLQGVAPGAKLAAYKVLSSGGSGSTSNVILGIERAADPNQDGNTEDHYDILSMSLGHSGGDPYTDPAALAVEAAVSAGVVATISAGNSYNYGRIGCPGCAENATTVGASTKTDGMAYFSSRGPEEDLIKPDVVAPGYQICAAQWEDAWAKNECLGDGEHTAISGTSMAAPHVAGAAALLLQARPELEPLEVKSMLMTTAVDIGEDALTQGAGRIDLVNAYDAEIATFPQSVGFNIMNLEDNETFLQKTFTIKNMKDEAHTFDLSLTDLEDQNFTLYNDIISIDVSSMELQPGETADVTLTIDMANVSPVGFVESQIMISGVNQNYHIPIMLINYYYRADPFDYDSFLDYGFDEDNDTYYDALVVELSMDKISADRNVYATLKDDNNKVFYAGADILDLEQGQQTVEMYVSSEELFPAQAEGPFEVYNLRLCGAYGCQSFDAEYFTDNYTYTDFDPTSIIPLEVVAEETPDENSNGFYDSLNLIVLANVTESGMYTIISSLRDENYDGVTYFEGYYVLEEGLNNITLEFDAHDISITGHTNMTYRITDLFISKDENENGEFYDDDAYSFPLYYETSAYNADDFEPYPVSLTGNFTEEVVDLDGDGHYDELRVNAEVEVLESGEYEFQGHLYGVEEIPEWGLMPYTFYYEEVFEYFDPGTYWVTFTAQGYQIYLSEVNGPYYLGYIDIEGETDSGDEFYYRAGSQETYTTFNYSYDEFERPPISLTLNFSDSGVDVDGNGLYEYLGFQPEVEVTDEGGYEISVRLESLYPVVDPTEVEEIIEEAEEMNISAYINYNGYLVINAWEEFYFEEGVHTPTINFNGVDIFVSAYDGPFSIDRVILYDDENNLVRPYYEVYTTNDYNHSDFERPPVTLVGNFTEEVVDENNNSYYDVLRISLDINVTEAADYDISFNLRTSDGNDYIDGDYIYDYFTEGVHVVTAEFSGLEIYLEGQNGPYSLFVDFETEEAGGSAGSSTEIEWNYDSVYQTAAYSYEEFEHPGASLMIENISEAVTDLDGDGQYDELLITMPLNVSVAGEYSLRGYLENGYDAITDDYISAYLETGIQEMTLTFNGEYIYQSEVNGSYNLNHVSLYQEGEGESEQLVHLHDVYQTLAYSYTDFERPPISLVNFTDSGVDTDADGYYNYLVIEAQMIVEEAGTYYGYARLEAPSGQNIDYFYTEEQYYETGIHIIQFNYSGMDIRSQEENGPYNVERIRFYELIAGYSEEVFIDYDMYQTGAYSYEDFEPLFAQLLNITDYGVDTNNNTLYDELVVNVELVVEETGEYYVYSSLEKHYDFNSDYYMGNFYGEFDLDAGYNEIELIFPGIPIYMSELDGPYTVDYLHIEKMFDGYEVSLEDLEQERLDMKAAYEETLMNVDEDDLSTDDWDDLYFYDVYDTQVYSYEEFEFPPVTLVGNFVEEVVDENSNSYYDVLSLSFDVNVTEADEYDIDVVLRSLNGNYVAYSDYAGLLEVGVQTITVDFSGLEIYSEEEDGPYTVDIDFDIEGDNYEFEWRYEEAYQTAAYSYEEFEHAGASIVLENITDYANDADDNGLYEELVIAVPVSVSVPGSYRLAGSLRSLSGMWIDYESEYVILESGVTEVELSFYGQQIYNQGFDGPYNLDYLSLSQHVEGSGYVEIEWINDPYQTAAYNYTDFEHVPATLTSNMWDEGVDLDGDGSYDILRLTLEVDVEVSGDYDFLAQLNTLDGEYIDYSGDSHNLSVGLNNVSIDFNGDDILREGTDGPYYVSYVYISHGNTYEYEYIYYTTNNYSYLDFAAYLDIVSTPDDEITLGETFSYQVEVMNPDGNNLTYSLIYGPEGMTINDYGLVEWTPDEANGYYPLGIRVSDGNISNEQYFDIDVDGIELILELDAPFSLDLFDQNYVLTVIGGNSADNYAIMSVNDDVETIVEGVTYTIGGLDIYIEDLFMSDVGNGTVVVELEIVGAYIVPSNEAPWIAPTILDQTANEDDETWVIDLSLHANDDHDDPSDMNWTVTVIDGTLVELNFVSEANNLLEITPVANAHGSTTMTFRLYDSEGLFESQDVALTINPVNDAPDVEPIDDGIIMAGTSFEVQVQASDVDGDNLTYVLTQAPAGMSIDATGLIEWIPSEAGTHFVNVSVSDYELFSYQVFNIEVIGYELGDLNFDHQLTVEDVLVMVDIILGIIDPTDEQLSLADLNYDGSINILDVVMLVDRIFDTQSVRQSVGNEVVVVDLSRYHGRLESSAVDDYEWVVTKSSSLVKAVINGETLSLKLRDKPDTTVSLDSVRKDSLELELTATYDGMVVGKKKLIFLINTKLVKIKPFVKTDELIVKPTPKTIEDKDLKKPDKKKLVKEINEEEKKDVVKEEKKEAEKKVEKKKLVKKEAEKKKEVKTAEKKVSTDAKAVKTI